MLGHSAAVAATAPATNPSNPRPSSVPTFTFIQTHLLSMEKPDFRAEPCHPLRRSSSPLTTPPFPRPLPPPRAPARSVPSASRCSLSRLRPTEARTQPRGCESVWRPEYGLV